MDIFEVEQKERVSREEAAARLRTLADMLARHNDVEFERGGSSQRAQEPQGPARRRRADAGRVRRAKAKAAQRLRGGLMEFGPVQMLVVGFDHGKFEGEILAELKRLSDHEIIRLVDLLFVNKDDDGTIQS